MWLYYLLLASAILLEVIGTCLFTAAKGFERPWLILIGLMLWMVAIVCFNFSLRGIDVSMAYAIWSAIGIALVTIVGFFYFNDHFHWIKVLFIAVIIIGVVGLKLSDYLTKAPGNDTSNAANIDHADAVTHTKD